MHCALWHLVNLQSQCSSCTCTCICLQSLVPAPVAATASIYNHKIPTPVPAAASIYNHKVRTPVPAAASSGLEADWFITFDVQEGKASDKAKCFSSARVDVICWARCYPNAFPECHCFMGDDPGKTALFRVLYRGITN